MKKETIKSHLRPYSIKAKRGTTINHAFASAVAPIDRYDATKILKILKELECTEGEYINCVYCGQKRAQTWDHLFALVKNGNPSGFGHTYGNLIPCCKDCNSTKGNQDWKNANEKINAKNEHQKARVIRLINNHIKNHPLTQNLLPKPTQKRLNEIKGKIFDLMDEADKIIRTTHAG